MLDIWLIFITTYQSGSTFKHYKNKEIWITSNLKQCMPRNMYWMTARQIVTIWNYYGYYGSNFDIIVMTSATILITRAVVLHCRWSSAENKKLFFQMFNFGKKWFYWFENAFCLQLQVLFFWQKKNKNTAHNFWKSNLIEIISCHALYKKINGKFSHRSNQSEEEDASWGKRHETQRMIVRH